MSFRGLLRNQVVIEVRSATTTHVESFIDGATIAASVQERTPQQLALPDVDGPVLVDCVIFTTYEDGASVRHLDVLRQIDVSPARRYQVILPKDPAGMHHHFEHQSKRLVPVPVSA